MSKATKIQTELVNQTAPTNGRAKNTTSHLRHSNFFLTFNSNKRYDPDSDSAREAIHHWEQCIIELFGAGYERAPKYLVSMESDHDISPKYIKKITGEYAIEIGPKTHCVHAHLSMCVSHYTKVRLNYEKVKEDLQRISGFDSIHFHSRVYSNAHDTISDYINKNRTYYDK